MPGEPVMVLTNNRDYPASAENDMSGTILGFVGVTQARKGGKPTKTKLTRQSSVDPRYLLNTP